MLRQHHGHRRDRGPIARRSSPAGRLSYANVIASLALFVALGGTGVAAVTLDHDSVGSPQIRKDAVRSPEIASGAVRSSEIRDEGINANDISTRARTELRGELKVAEDDRARDAQTCAGADLSACPNHLELQLVASQTPRPGGRQLDPGPTVPGGTPSGPQGAEPGRNWLVQAKLHIVVAKPFGEAGTPGDSTGTPADPTPNRCGLVNAAAAGRQSVLDQVQVGESKGSLSENIALSALVSKRANNPLIALRCTSQQGDRVTPSFVKITALEVGAATTG
jgi:hypothetical protein